MSGGNIRFPNLKSMNEELFEPMLSISKLFISGALVSGSIYLLVYCASNNIPVPISLAELPTLLVAIFGVGSFFAMLVLVLVLMPCMPRAGIVTDTFPRLFVMRRDRRSGAVMRREPSKGGVYRKFRWKVEMRNVAIYWVCIALPTIEVFGYIFAVSAWEPDSLLGAFTLYLMIPSVLVGLYALGLFSSLSRWSRAGRTVTRAQVAGDIGCLGLMAFSWMSIIYFIVLSKVMRGQHSDAILLLVVFGVPILLLLVFYFLMVPRAFSVGVSVRGVVTGCIILIAIAPVMPFVSTWTSGAALRALHLGGAYGAKLRLTEGSKGHLPPEFLKDANPKDPSYVPVHVLLNLGDYVYVRRPDDAGNPVAILRADIESEEIVY